MNSPAQIPQFRDLTRPDAASHAAAFCYRRTRRGLKILLVRTKNGAWTLPKGRIEDEHAAAAARREALEEAGAAGRVSRAPFDFYLDWKRSAVSPRGGRPVVIQAHLLEVRELLPPQERYRRPKWFKPKEAARLLRRRRHHRYARELERVVTQAVRLLAGEA